MDGDPFETVAIAHSLPQARVLMSFLEWHGLSAYAMNIETVGALHQVVALGGIPIRVHRSVSAEAHELLLEVADAAVTEAVAKPHERAGLFGIGLLCLMLGGAAPPPRVAATLRD